MIIGKADACAVSDRCAAVVQAVAAMHAAIASGARSLERSGIQRTPGALRFGRFCRRCPGGMTRTRLIQHFVALAAFGREKKQPSENRWLFEDAAVLPAR